MSSVPLLRETSLDAVTDDAKPGRDAVEDEAKKTGLDAMEDEPKKTGLDADAPHAIRSDLDALATDAIRSGLDAVAADARSARPARLPDAPEPVDTTAPSGFLNTPALAGTSRAERPAVEAHGEPTPADGSTPEDPSPAAPAQRPGTGDA